MGSIIEFDSKSGRLTAERLEHGWIRLDFPSAHAEPCEPPEGLLEALGVPAVWVGKSRFEYLSKVETEDMVRSLELVHTMLQRLPCAA